MLCCSCAPAAPNCLWPSQLACRMDSTGAAAGAGVLAPGRVRSSCRLGAGSGALAAASAAAASTCISSVGVLWVWESLEAARWIGACRHAPAAHAVSDCLAHPGSALPPRFGPLACCCALNYVSTHPHTPPRAPTTPPAPWLLPFQPPLPLSLPHAPLPAQPCEPPLPSLPPTRSPPAVGGRVTGRARVHRSCLLSASRPCDSSYPFCCSLCPLQGRLPQAVQAHDGRSARASEHAVYACIRDRCCCATTGSTEPHTFLIILSSTLSTASATCRSSLAIDLHAAQNSTAQHSMDQVDCRRTTTTHSTGQNRAARIAWELAPGPTHL